MVAAMHVKVLFCIIPRYLLSASKDQTTRLHGAWKTEAKVRIIVQFNPY